MTAVSLTTLRARVRERADMPIAGFVADSATSLDAWINEGVQQLHEKLIEAYGSDYKETSASYTTTGTDNVPLPADFFKLLGVDMNLAQGVATLSAFNRAERNAFRNATVSYRSLPCYKLSGNNLRLLPAPATGTTGTIWYAPVATLLVNAGDTVDFPNGWERYVVLYAAIQALMKEESSVHDLRIELASMEAKLQSIIENRDAGQPMHAADVDLVNIDPRWIR